MFLKFHYILNIHFKNMVIHKSNSYLEDWFLMKNAKNLIENVKLKHSEFGLTVNFPKDLDYKMINGKVFLYRPSNKQLDFEIPISISKPYLLVPEKRLLDGRWNIIVSWNYENKDYLFKKELNL